MRGIVKVEWNSQAVIELIKDMAAQEETGAARRVFAYAVRDAPCEDGVWRSIFMHRLITDAKKGFVVDHINGDGLDNRREN